MSNAGIDLQKLSIAELQNLKRSQEIRLSQLEAANKTREAQIAAPAGASKYLKFLTGGDAMTINNVIWPYQFVVDANTTTIDPEGRASGAFQVTQEACFVWTKLSKVVFEVDFDTQELTYINPRDLSGVSDANGLSFTLTDSSSSRTFMEQPLPLDQIGDPTRPFIKDRPMLLQPLQLMRIEFFNENPTRKFVPFLIFHGYRIRLENQHDLLSLQTNMMR